jgi:hypothetical protein
MTPALLLNAASAFAIVKTDRSHVPSKQLACAHKVSPKSPESVHGRNPLLKAKVQEQSTDFSARAQHVRSRPAKLQS